MSRGPRIRLSSNAVTAAYAALNVMYLNTLKTEMYSESGYSR